MPKGLEIGFPRSGFDVEFEHDLFADEVVGLPRIFHLEIKAVQEELSGDIDGIVGDFYGGREGDVLGDAMESEVARDG